MRWTILTMMSAMILTAANAQDRDLFADLKDLNVRHTTPHYALAGTVTDARLREYGQALELAYREYAAGFGELLQPRGKQDARGKNEETPDRFRVVVLAKAEEYKEFTRAYFDSGAEYSTGLFVSAAKLLIIQDTDDRQDTYGTLFHEAFHQFAKRYVPKIPIWLNEGLATYYGTARPQRGKLIFKNRQSPYFSLIRDAANQKQLIPLRELLESTQPEFYDSMPVEGLLVTRKSLCYGESFTLVSYMVNDREGRRFLRKYIRALTEAKTSEDARKVTREMFTDELLAAMIGPWLAHVGR